MPFVAHRGQRIHYDVRGQGPIVVLAHGLFSSGARFRENGYVEALARDYRVVTVDSLGHGESDKPPDASLYGRQQRAGDLVAVFDAIGAERVHLVGYSMGAWMATGVAIHHPSRLASLILGGWDPAFGVQLAGGVRPSFDMVLAGTRARLPEFVEWITPDVVPAVAACFRALSEIDGAVEAIAALSCPVMLWAGEDDACYAGMKSLARARGFELLSVRGDHAGAVVLSVPRVVEQLTQFFRDAAG